MTSGALRAVELDLSVTVTLAIFGQNSRTKRSTLSIVEKLEQASRDETDLAEPGCPSRIGALPWQRTPDTCLNVGYTSAQGGDVYREGNFSSMDEAHSAYTMC